MSPAPDRSPTAAESRGLLIAFVVLAGVHFWLVTRNWTSGQLTGNEFRQTQTALSAFFIRQEHNFSPAYPTPVLGKPWSIPMEFPLYQWTVVGVANLSGCTLPVAGRIVTLACFYLALPALALLAGELGLAGRRRWLLPLLALTCPIYIFYSRAFLIESMALMCSAWFLAAYLRTMATRTPGWLALTILCGVAAALVKVTTFMVWVAPAALHGAWALWRARAGRGNSLASTLAWGLACAAAPCGAALCWVRVADGIKALNPSGRILMSGNLNYLNFGPWAERFRPEVWRTLLATWDHAIMPGWLIVLFTAAAVAVTRARLRIVLGLAGFFLLIQFVFPRLYSWQDYYFYACAAVALAAAAVVLDALWDRLPRPAWRWLVLLVVAGVQLDDYRRNFYPVQIVPSNGGSQLTGALRDFTPGESVLLVAGEDWNSMTPYYAQRRALMLRASTEEDWPLVDQAFAQLAGEDVAALLLTGEQRKNTALLARAERAFAIDPRVVLSSASTDVYLARDHREGFIRGLMGSPRPGLTLRAAVATNFETAHGELLPVPEALGRTVFARMHPLPTHYKFATGLIASADDGRQILGAHPDAELWFTPPATARRITWEYGLNPAAYTKSGDHTDGVEFILTERRTDGTERELFRRWLKPEALPADRGLQTLHLDWQPAGPGSRLRFSTAPGGSYAYDWAYWGEIRIE